MNNNANQEAIEAPDLQRAFWNDWNASSREQKPLDEPSLARGAHNAGSPKDTGDR
jgi:hypothetical protein